MKDIYRILRSVSRRALTPLARSAATAKRCQAYERSQDRKFVRSLTISFFLSQNKSLAGDSSIAGAGGVCRNSSSNSWLKSRTSPTSRTGSGSSAADMNVQLGSAGSPTLRLASVKVSSRVHSLSLVLSLNGFFNARRYFMPLFATDFEPDSRCRP